MGLAADLLPALEAWTAKEMEFWWDKIRLLLSITALCDWGMLAKDVVEEREKRMRMENAFDY